MRVALPALLGLLACGGGGGGGGGEIDAGACPGTPLPQPPGLVAEEEARISELMAQMSIAEKIAQLHGDSVIADGGRWWTAANTRLGIPGFAMVDGPRGVHAGNATCFPVGMARGATFDRELERDIGEAMALEAAAHGASALLAPTVNVLRHPAWGRAQETYGEDPYALGELGAAFVAGAQASGRVIATVKHYAANSIEDTRFDVSVELSERVLREVYLPHFRKVVGAGVGAVMTAYNKVNGVYASENPHLVREVLLDEWGFDGFVMSDWVLGTRSAGPAVNAGLDMEMPTKSEFNGLMAAVLSCEVTEATLDDAVRRVLRAKLRFGVLDGQPEVPADVIESEAHLALALRAARESIVMLKNGGGVALPVSVGDEQTIAVVGALADVANLGDDGSSDVTPSTAVTPAGGLRTRFGAERVVVIGSDVLDDAARAAVSTAVATVVVVGLTSDDEGENIPGGNDGGDRETLALSAEEIALIEEVAALNGRTIVVLEGGSAVLTSPWIDDVEGVLMAWYPGQLGGTAIAEIIAGDVSPSGRLPISFPVAEADLPEFDHTSLEVEYGLFHGYRWFDREGAAAPAFEFGFGLGYGEVDYVGVTLPGGTTVARDGVVEVAVELASVDRDGDEVVQLYVEPPAVDGVERFARTLQGFARVTLTPGAHATVTMQVPVAELARWDEATSAWVIDPGTYAIAVGRSSRDLPLRTMFAVTP
jgi:beta-glucosidase